MLLLIVQLFYGQYDSDQVRRLQYLVWLLATLVLFIGGNTILRGAWRALRAHTATMETLAAYSYGVYIIQTGSSEI